MDPKAPKFVPKVIRDSIAALEKIKPTDADLGGEGQLEKYNELLRVANSLQSSGLPLPKLVNDIIDRDKRGTTVNKGVLNGDTKDLLAALKAMQGGRRRHGKTAKKVRKTRSRVGKGRRVTRRKLRGGLFGIGEKPTVAPRSSAPSREGSVNRATLEATYADPVKRVKGMKLLISLAEQVKAKAASVKTKEDALAATQFEVDREGMEWVKSALDEYKKQYPPPSPSKLAKEIREKLGFRTLEDSILALQTGRASPAMAGSIALAGIEAVKKLGVQAGGADDNDKTTAELGQLAIAAGDGLLWIVVGFFKLIFGVALGAAELIGGIVSMFLGGGG